MTNDSKQAEECHRCGGTGWVDCEADPHCAYPSHGSFCSCPEGVERQRAET